MPVKIPLVHAMPSHNDVLLQGEVLGSQDSRPCALESDFLNLRSTSDSGMEKERGERARRVKRTVGAADMFA